MDIFSYEDGCVDLGVLCRLPEAMSSRWRPALYSQKSIVCNVCIKMIFYLSHSIQKIQVSYFLVLILLMHFDTVCMMVKKKKCLHAWDLSFTYGSVSCCLINDANLLWGTIHLGHVDQPLLSSVDGAWIVFAQEGSWPLCGRGEPMMLTMLSCRGKSPYWITTDLRTSTGRGAGGVSGGSGLGGLSLSGVVWYTTVAPACSPVVRYCWNRA